MRLEFRATLSKTTKSKIRFDWKRNWGSGETSPGVYCSRDSQNPTHHVFVNEKRGLEINMGVAGHDRYRID